MTPQEHDDLCKALNTHGMTKHELVSAYLTSELQSRAAVAKLWAIMANMDRGTDEKVKK